MKGNCIRGGLFIRAFVVVSLVVFVGGGRRREVASVEETRQNEMRFYVQVVGAFPSAC